MDFDTFETLKEKIGVSGFGKPALVGLAAIMVMVAVLAGRYAFDTATAKEFQIESDPRPSLESEASASTVPEKTVYVHVTGAVGKPGVYELAEGSRVAAAIQAAGGFSDDAQLDSCNLARVLVDGEQLKILSVEEAASVEAKPDNVGGGETKSGSSGIVNVNTASESELETLPGIGPSTAKRIVADREEKGPFESVEDLTRVSGIGEKKLESIAGLVSVS